MMSASQLAQVDGRLREVGDPESAFGGFGIILMGDFYQLSSVGSKPLYAASLETLSGDGQCAMIGGQLFREFKLLELTQQMRAAECNVQKSLVDSFRSNECPIHRQHLQHLKQLTARDIRDDPSWLDAVIVTPGNQIRNAVNRDNIVRLAQRLGVPVVRWKLPLTDQCARQLPARVVDDIYSKCSDAWAYFVASAPANIDFNMNPSLGVANGSSCLLHSLVLHPSSDVDDIEQEFSDAAPGDYVDIPPPHAVNVTLVGPAADTWPDDAPSVDDLRPPVLPLPGRGRNTVLLGPKILDDSRGTRKRRALSASTSGFDLGFSATFHKIQGKTVEKIILCLNKEPRDLGRLTTQALYVGITRVRRNRDMRIFPLPSGQNLDHLLRLKVDPKIKEWRSHYNANGCWQPAGHDSTSAGSTAQRQTSAVGPMRRSTAQQRSLSRHNPLGQTNRGGRGTTGRGRSLANRSPGVTRDPTGCRREALRPLSWGSPRDQTYSWLFVPVIRAALQLDAHREYLIETLAGHQRWSFWVNAYREDFERRGITPDTLPFQPNGYLPAGYQEQLIYNDSPMYDIHGESTVATDVQNTLLAFGVEVHGAHVTVG